MGSKWRVLVTGSSGVIGRQLTSRLLEREAEVVAIDRRAMPSGNWSDLRFIQGDLSQMDLSLIADFAPQTVFHLAASFERSEESPGYWQVGWRDDVVASHRIIDAIRGCAETTRFVFASSYLVYDPSSYFVHSADVEPVRLVENMSVSPRNLCGAGKYYTERELRFIRQAGRSDLSVVNARIFRVYGRGSQDVISRWIRTALSGGSIEVFNRSNRFDYVFADDVAEAVLRLGMDGSSPGVYNVGTGVASRIDDVVACLLELGIVETDRVLDSGETAPWEASVADVSALRRELGWVPSTPLRRGIELVAEDAALRTGV